MVTRELLDRLVAMGVDVPILAVEEKDSSYIVTLQEGIVLTVAKLEQGAAAPEPELIPYPVYRGAAPTRGQGRKVKKNPASELAGPQPTYIGPQLPSKHKEPVPPATRGVGKEPVYRPPSPDAPGEGRREK